MKPPVAFCSLDEVSIVRIISQLPQEQSACEDKLADFVVQKVKNQKSARYFSLTNSRPANLILKSSKEYWRSLSLGLSEHLVSHVKDKNENRLQEREA